MKKNDKIEIFSKQIAKYMGDMIRNLKNASDEELLQTHKIFSHYSEKDLNHVRDMEGIKNSVDLHCFCVKNLSVFEDKIKVIEQKIYEHAYFQLNKFSINKENPNHENIFHVFKPDDSILEEILKYSGIMDISPFFQFPRFDIICTDNMIVNQKKGPFSSNNIVYIHDQELQSKRDKYVTNKFFKKYEYAPIRKYDKQILVGLVDKNNNVVVQPEYDTIINLSKEYSVFIKNQKYYLHNNQGKLLSSSNDSFVLIGNYYAQQMNKGFGWAEYKLFDKNGKIILPDLNINYLQISESKIIDNKLIFGDKNNVYLVDIQQNKYFQFPAKAVYSFSASFKYNKQTDKLYIVNEKKYICVGKLADFNFKDAKPITELTNKQEQVM